MTLFGRTSPSEAEAERAYRRRWILIPGVVVLLCVVVGLVTSLGPWREQEATFQQAYPAGITKVEVENPGELAVASTSGDQVKALWETRWNYRRPKVRAERDGDTMRLHLDCSSSVSVECSADLRLAVPRNVALDITSSSGDVVVGGVSGPVTVDASSGDVHVAYVDGDVRVDNLSGETELDAIGGDVTAETKSGDIKASGLNGKTARLTNFSGDIKAGFGVAPEHVTVESKSGDVKVKVPKGSGPYQVRPDVRSGDLRTEVRTDPTAKPVIDVSALSGDVRIVYGDDDGPKRPRMGDRPGHERDMPERPEHDMPEMPDIPN